jgi:hypothetical protein
MLSYSLANSCIPRPLLFKNWLPRRPCSRTPHSVLYPASRRGLATVLPHNLSYTRHGLLERNSPIIMGPPSRFDWRQRVPARRLDATADVKDGPRRLKRIAAPTAEIQRGDKFYDEINAYRERYALHDAQYLNLSSYRDPGSFLCSRQNRQKRRKFSSSAFLIGLSLDYNAKAMP